MLFKDLIELCKLRIQIVALSAAWMCYWLATAGNPGFWNSLQLLGAMFLVCSGAAAWNQALEMRTDALMERTRNRPLPAGRLQQHHVFLGAGFAVFAGCLWLAVGLSTLAGILAFAMVILYDFVYTPLKRLTSLNTVVGAFPGAMPILIGWAAADQGLNFTAWVLFGILFLWQFPHFMAVAWLCREDYERAGLRMISVNDIRGYMSGRQAVSFSLVLVPVSLLPSLNGGAGPVYFYGALLLSLVFLALALWFFMGGSQPRARWLMRGSLVYLPLLLVLLVVDTVQAAG